MSRVCSTPILLTDKVVNLRPFPVLLLPVRSVRQRGGRPAKSTDQERKKKSKRGGGALGNFCPLLCCRHGFPPPFPLPKKSEDIRPAIAPPALPAVSKGKGKRQRNVPAQSLSLSLSLLSLCLVLRTNKIPGARDPKASEENGIPLFFWCNGKLLAKMHPVVVKGLRRLGDSATKGGN